MSFVRDHLQHNFRVNVLDATFFGFGMGFASNVTVIPLFVDSLTDTTVLIGLVGSLHIIGWHLPQVLMAGRVARLPRYLPLVLRMTLHERWPYFGLMIIALLIGLNVLSAQVALVLAFIMLGIHALGGGFTATAWQSMIAKIIPPRRRGTFWGTQSAGASLLMAAGGYTAGLILVAVPYPYNFAACFLLTSVTMAVSMIFLAFTQEEQTPPLVENAQTGIDWARYNQMLRRDPNLRVFIMARSVAQFGWMAVGFYTVYGVRQFGMDEAAAGAMLAVMTILQTIANPVLGWMGDVIGHRRVFAGGALLLAASVAVALFAPSVGWLYVAFGLAGSAQATLWTVAMTMTVDFGPEQDRPYTIGVVNTLMAPAALIAPLMGGLLADLIGFEATFALALVAALLTATLLLFFVRDPRPRAEAVRPAPAIGD
ncbi:MAG: MFS transporter [Anaerolineae bacterium]